MGNNEQLESKDLLVRKSILRNKNFLLLMFAHFLSEFGSTIYMVGITWFILDISGDLESGLHIAYFYTCFYIPIFVLGPFFGVFLDKYNRKIILSLIKFLSAFSVLLLVPFIYFDFYPFIAILSVTVLRASFGVLYRPAIGSIMPNIVHPENLIKANSFSMGNDYVCWTLGAVFAGLLYTSIGLINIILLTGVLYLIFGIIILYIKLPKTLKSEKAIKRFKPWNNFKFGLIYINKERVLLVTLIFALAINFFSNPFSEVLLPKIIKFSLNLGADQYGLIKAIFPLGSIAGLIICSILPKGNALYRKILCYGLIVLAVAHLLYALPIIPYFSSRISGYNIFIFYCIVSFVRMVFDAFINVPLFTAFQLRVPDKYRGRFFSLQNTAFAGVKPLGVLFIGYISSYMPSYLITFYLGLILLVLVIWLILLPVIKELFDLEFLS
jgi:MFS transporter, DHA3 family, macrolide efflux protein